MWNLFVMVARGSVLVLVGFFLMSALASAASAAPQRLSSDPQEGAELHEAPEEVSITFSEPLLEGSAVRVVDECERRIDDGSPQITLNEISVGIEEKTSGTYSVTYSAVGPTGTATGGFTFTVHGRPVCDKRAGDHHGDEGGGGSGGSGGHGGGHGGGGGGGGAEPDHGKGSGHGDGSSSGSAGGGHSSGAHTNGADASHAPGEDSNHSAGSRTTAEQHHRSRRDARGTGGDSVAANFPVASGGVSEARDKLVSSAWTTVGALALAAFFGIGAGWLLRGARLTRAAKRTR